MPTSQNGYPANNQASTKGYLVGDQRELRLRKGPAGELLAMFARDFDAHVENIDGGQLDDWGYAERPIRGSTTTLSNHASGTAADLNAPRHPLGKRGTYTPAQVAEIRKLLAKYGGCIRWGGDYWNRADEMHFEIIKDEKTCAAQLAKLKAVAIPEPKPTPVDRLDRAGDMLRAALPYLEAANKNLALVDLVGVPVAKAAEIKAVTAEFVDLYAQTKHRTGQLPRTDKEARA